MDSHTTRVKTFISSKTFLKIILILVLLQGLWYALSFQPTIFDEGRHVGFIEMYSERTNPLMDQQETRWDHLGDTTRDPNYLYYFIMSLPLKVIKIFTSSYFVQVLLLRLIHIGLFMLAIWAYHKALTKLRFSKATTSLTLFLLVLTPAIAPLAGVVTYDTPAFLMSGLLLLQAATIIRAKKINSNQILLFLATVLFGSIIKYTFIAFALPVVAFVLWYVFRTKKYKKIEKSANKKQTWVFAAVCVLGLGLFVERPVYNQLHYGKITPSCIGLHGEERCIKNYVQERDIVALERKPQDFQPKSLYEFTFVDWIPNMVRSQVRLNPWDSIISPLFLFYTLALFGGVIIIIYKFDHFLRKDTLRLVIVAIAGLSLALLLKNYQSYTRLDEVVATSSRYLLPAQPLFMAAVLFAITRLGPKFKYLVIALASILLFVSLVRGGGIVTYAKQAPPELKWSARE